MLSGNSITRLKVWPDTYAEAYAEANGYDYVYRMEEDAQINGVLTVTLNSDLYREMQLVLTTGDRQIQRTISGEDTYTFMGLSVGAECVVTVCDRQGNTVAAAEPVIITENTAVRLEDVQTIGSLAVSIRDESGSDMAACTHVTGIAAGTRLTGRIVLEGALARRCRLPADLVHTVASGENKINVTLTALGEHQLSGLVKNSAGDPIPAATVIVDQRIHGEYEARGTAVTDKDGRFDLRVPAAPAQVTVYAKGYGARIISLDQPDRDTDLGGIALEPLSGAQIRLDAAQRESLSDERGTALQHLDGLNITIINKTTGSARAGIWSSPGAPQPGTGWRSPCPPRTTPSRR